MQKRLKSDIIEYELAELDANFPITAPSHIVRGEISPVQPHVHNCLEIGYCFEGTGIFTIEDKILPYHAGDAVIINHREVHQAVSSLGQVSVWSFIHLNPVLLLSGHIIDENITAKPELLCGSDFVNIIRADDNPAICQVILDIINEMRQQPQNFQAIVRALVFIMMTRLQSIVPATVPEVLTTLKRENLARISPAIRYITNHFMNSLTIAQLAKSCYLSEPHFRKIFKSATGLSPLQYITKIRMHAAALMLKNSDQKIIRIATDCGYSTLSSFNRSFQATFKMSPREYRKITSIMHQSSLL